MWEKAKSVILAILVLASFYLTGQLWLVHYSPPLLDPDRGEFARPQPLEVVSPVAIWVHASGESRAYVPGPAGFLETWSFLQAELSGATIPAVRLVTERDWLRAYAADNIEFRLAGRVQLRMWLETLGVQSGQLNAELSLDRVMLSLHDNHIYFWDTEKGTFLIWENMTNQGRLPGVQEATRTHLAQATANWPGQELRSLSANVRVRVAPWVRVPAQSALWPQLLARHERGQNNQLIASFFPDWTLVRRVVQRDGRIAFTDGQRHVYLHPDGSVRYVATSWFNPIYDITARASVLLGSSLRFVARHGGWPEDVRMSLMAVEHPPGGVAQMRFHFVPFASFTSNGRTEFVPVVSRERQLVLTVNERDVSDYMRSLYHPVDVGASPTRIITPEAAIRLVEASLLPEKAITEVMLGFYQRPIDAAAEFLFPVWVIEQGAGKFVVNAYTGDIVSR